MRPTKNLHILLTLLVGITSGITLQPDRARARNLPDLLSYQVSQTENPIQMPVSSSVEPVEKTLLPVHEPTPDLAELQSDLGGMDLRTWTEMDCNVSGQNAWLFWELSGEAGDSLPPDSLLRLTIPMGLAPELPPGAVFDPEQGIITLPVIQQGGVRFFLAEEMVKRVFLTVEVIAGERIWFASHAWLEPGGYGRVEPTGGRVQARLLGVDVEIPGEAVLETTSICIQKAKQEELATALSDQPFEITAWNTADGERVTEFHRQVVIRVTYDEERYQGAENRLFLFYYDFGMQDWVALPSQVEAETNLLNGLTYHFTPFDFKPEGWESPRLPTMQGYAVSQFSGAATYTLPIQVPAGPGGWQPSLNLSYNSQVVDSASSQTQASWVGMGWNLETGAILRQMGDNLNYYGAPGDQTGAVDDDTTHDGDDTFLLVLNDQSWQLLRLGDQDGDPNTIDYATADESFLRIRRYHMHAKPDAFWWDMSYWMVWDAYGNTYQFGGAWETNAHYPAAQDGCANTFMLTWKWSLVKARNLHNQEITYSYTTETLQKYAAGCDGYFANTDVAVYPDTITYPNGKYRIRFEVSANRLDHKATWVNNRDAIVLFERSRLAAIHIEHWNGSGWEGIRKYVLGYVDGNIFPNLKWQAAYESSKTPTLISLTEYGSDGQSSLPATTLTYDGMHLVRAENGYGGSVEFGYEVDDGEPWYELQTTQPSVQYYGFDTWKTPGVNIWVGDALGVYDPGQAYKIEMKAYLLGANDTCAMVLVDGTGVDKPAQILDKYQLEGDSNTYFRFLSHAPVEANQVRFYFNCTSYNQYIPRSVNVYPLVTRYRVNARTDTSSVPSASQTTTYHYSGAATNNATLSPDAGSKPYTELRTQYRGHKLVTETQPGGLTTATWHHQQDGFTGRQIARLQMELDIYDDFHELDTGLWTYSHPLTRQVITSLEGEPVLKMANPTTDWSVTAQRVGTSVGDGTSVVLQFLVEEATTETVFAFVHPSNNSWEYRRWGIYLQQNGGEQELVVQYKMGDDPYQTESLLDAGQFDPGKWYVLVLTAGEGQFVARVWEREDPSHYGESSLPMTDGLDWYFKSYVSNGTVFMEEYWEGPLHTLSLAEWGAREGDYTAPVIVSPRANASEMYTGLAVRWNTLLKITSWSLAANGFFRGSSQMYYHDPSYQGNHQYGNRTRVYEAAWEGSAWVNQRVTWTRYFPNASSNAYLVSLPAAIYQYACTTGQCIPESEPSYFGTLIDLTLNWYDSAVNFWTQPTTGKLTVQKKLLNASIWSYQNTRYEYDAWGNTTTVTRYTVPTGQNDIPSAGGQATTTCFGQTGDGTFCVDDGYHTFPGWVKNAAGHVTRYSHDYRLGVPLTETGPNGAGSTVIAGYDVFGRLTSLIRPGDDASSPTIQIAYYDTANPYYEEIRQKLDASTTNVTRRFYDGMGRLILTHLAGAVLDVGVRTVMTHTLYEYNDIGLKVSRSMPYPTGNAWCMEHYCQPVSEIAVTMTQYDALGRVVWVKEPQDAVPGSYALQVYYSVQPNCLKRSAGDTTASLPCQVTQETARNGETTTTNQNSNGLTGRVQGPEGPAVAYYYDKMGRLVDAVYGTAVTHLVHDQGGRKTSQSDPDMGTWIYAYDALGNLIRQTDARGQRICLYYDNLNRLTGKHYRSDDACPAQPDTYDIAFSYDSGSNGIGNRTGMTDGSGSTTWGYDARNRLIAETRNISGSGSFQTQWTYNSANQLHTIRYPANNAGGLGETVTYTYLPQMALNTVVGNSSYVSNTQYDSAGRLLERQLSGGVLRQRYTYDVGGWTMSGSGWLDTYTAGTNTPDYNSLLNLGYSYDSVGNILSIVDALAGGTQTQSFGYDTLNRLTSAAAVGGTQGTYPLESYTYDPDTGNLDSKAGVVFSYGDPAHPHAVTHINAEQKYAYDANGNQVQRASDSLIYDAENRLIQVKKGETVLATFVYNGDGERVKSILDGTTTAFVGNHLEWTGSMGTMKKYYYAGSQRVAVQNGMLAPPNYLLGDHLGSTSVTTNSAGNFVAEMLYKPFGEVRYTSGTTPTQYTYTGQYSNMAEIGLMYYNTRWYDPYLNRWVQPDSIIPDPGNPQDWNRYSYVRDNPLKYTDPTGHWACGDYYDTGCVETFAEAGAMMRSTGMNALAGGKTTLPIVARKDWGQYAPGDNPGNFSDEDRETYDPNNEFGGYYEYPGNLADTLDSAVIHHVGDGGVTNSPQAIENAHMVGLGHYDVGYHFIAGADGTIYEGRYIGARGYHVQKYNTGKIGVVLIGDFSGDISPTQIQVDATLGLLLYLDAKYGIDFVNGHSDYPDQGNTICPGQNMAKPINMFRSFIE